MTKTFLIIAFKHSFHFFSHTSLNEFIGITMQISCILLHFLGGGASSHRQTRTLGGVSRLGTAVYNGSYFPIV